MVYMLNNETKQYARYLLNSNKRLYFIIWISLFVVTPFLIILSNATDSGLQALIAFTIFFGCALACLTPIFLFRFIYLKRSSDLYFSLPIERKKLFSITFFTGFIAVLIPVIINILIIVILSHTLIDTSNRISIFSILTTGIMMFALYGIITWVVQQCNNLLDGILVSGSYIVVPVIFLAALMVFLNNQFSSFMVASGSYIAEIPFHNVIPNLLSIPYSAVSGTWLIFRNPVTSFTWIIQIYWLVVGIVFALFAKRSFIRRMQEDSEQRTTVWWVYPLIIGVLTFCLILLIVNANMPIASIVISSISVFILYLCMVFFSRRKIQITLRIVLLFVALYAGSYMFSIVFQKTQGFQIVKEIPNADNISKISIEYYSQDYENGQVIPFKAKYHAGDKEKTVNIYNFSAIGENKKEIDEILTAQKEIIERKPDENELKNTLYIKYELKNKASIFRYYEINQSTAIKLIESVLSSNANHQTNFNISYKQNADS